MTRRKRLSPEIVLAIQTHAHRRAIEYRKGIEAALVAQAERLYAMKYPDVLTARILGIHLVQEEYEEF